MELIIINFGLVRSAKFFPCDSWRALGSADIKNVSDADVCRVGSAVLEDLRAIGCVLHDHLVQDGDASNDYEPTFVVRCDYPVYAELADCYPPSVLRYEKYTRLYEVACKYAQDAVAVLPDYQSGLLVGANAQAWGSFDIEKFIEI